MTCFNYLKKQKTPKKLMKTYLYLHRESVTEQQEQFRGRYELRHVDYEFSRTTDRHGAIASDVRGGVIRVAIDGFADALLLAWLFSQTHMEDGEIVTLDPTERVVEKLSFKHATALDFRMNFDSRLKEALITTIRIEAAEIETDNDLYVQNR